jgi:pSer/pThr/pTyr-binding forkhead associated (FHA) protein
MPILSFGQQSRALGPGVLTIGSAPEAGWRLIEYDLEPVHALFAPGLGGRMLLSAGSPQARIFVNGTPIGAETYALSFGDVVRLGGTAEFTLRERPLDAGPTGGPAYLHDRHRDRLYRLNEETSIGRDVQCAVFIQDPEVSRAHACVERRKDARGKDNYVVSPSGGVTLLNGDRIVAPSPLREGDEITVGRTRLRFSWDTPRHGAQAVSAASEWAASSPLARRASREPTTFMGTLESRERLTRDARRRIGRRTAIVVAVAALGAALVASIVQHSLPQVSLSTSKASAQTTR